MQILGATPSETRLGLKGENIYCELISQLHCKCEKYGKKVIHKNMVRYLSQNKTSTCQITGRKDIIFAISVLLGQSIQIFYLSKTIITTVEKYSITYESYILETLV